MKFGTVRVESLSAKAARADCFFSVRASEPNNSFRRFGIGVEVMLAIESSRWIAHDGERVASVVIRQPHQDRSTTAIPKAGSGDLTRLTPGWKEIVGLRRVQNAM